MNAYLTVESTDGGVHRVPFTGVTVTPTSASVNPGGGSELPVGSIYENGSVGTNPATLLGYGTWVLFGVGRVMVCIDSADTDFDVVGELQGAKTVAASGSVSAPTISGSTANESSHTHAFGTLAASAPTISGSTATEAAHTHSVTSNVAVAGHAAGVTGANSGAAVKIGTGASNAAPTAHTHTTPALTHGVTNNAVTSGAGSAHSHGTGTLVASAPTISGATAAGSAHLHGAGTLAASAPTFTGNATSVVQPSIVVYRWIRTA